MGKGTCEIRNLDMNTFLFVISSLLVIVPAFIFVFSRKYFYYSILVLYPIIGQSVGSKTIFFGVNVNPSMLFGILVLVLTSVDFITKRSKDWSLELLVLLFIFYAVLISFFSPVRFESLSWALKIATWLLILLAAIKTFENRKDLRQIYRAIAVSVIVVIISFILSKLGLYGESKAYAKGIELYGGGFSTGKIIAYYLAITVFILASWDIPTKAAARYGSIALVCGAILTIILTFVRAPIIAMLIGLVSFLFYNARFGRKSYLISLTIFLAFACFLILVYQFWGESRYMSRWMEFEHRIAVGDVEKVGSGRLGGLINFKKYYLHRASLSRKIFGSGLGSSFVLLGNKKFIHNDFAEILLGCGLIGFVLYIAIIIKLYLLLMKILKKEIHLNQKRYLIFALSNLFVFLAFHMTNVSSGVFVLIPWAMWTGATIAVGKVETRSDVLRGKTSGVAIPA